MHRLPFFASIMSLLFNPTVTWAQLSRGHCSTVGAYCRITGDNLLGIVSEVNSLTECLDMANEAAFATYYGPAGFPYVDSCLLYSTCDTLDPCEDCVTQDLRYPCNVTYCSAPIEGTLGTNLISVIGEVSDEGKCQQLCQGDDLCSVYTYHQESAAPPQTCYLLTSVEAPVRECADDSCATGPPSCKGDSYCAFLDYGTASDGVMVTKDADREVTILRLGLGDCPPVVAMAVGGGAGKYGYCGGGGSGYVSYNLSLPQKEYMKLFAHAGSNGEDSYVVDQSDGQEVVRGASGADGGECYGEYDGGAGYSGGGGFGCTPDYDCAGAGGSNGGDGGNGCNESSPGPGGVGGDGSKLDLSTIPMKNFLLSPGIGGVGGTESCYGGGGGGVLIDNGGPPRPDGYAGEGYGGGGSRPEGNGLPGVVILDFQR